MPDSPEQPALAGFDPSTREFAQDPYPVYARLRQQAQPCFDEPLGAVLLARYADVDQAAREPVLVRSVDAFMAPEARAAEKRKANLHDMPNHARFVQFSLLESDGEVHRRLRTLVLRHFSKAFVERHRPMIRRYVDALLDQVLQQREIDFIADFAAHVPGHVIGNVLGVPDEDCPQLRVWSEDVVQFFDIGRTQADKQRAERATTEFYRYLLDLIALRRRHPREDLLTMLLQAQDAGELDETELISTLMLILMAGHGSTIDVLGTGLLALLQHPAELQRLRTRPALMPTAVQEMFRYDAPLPYFHRYASADVEIAGQRYRKGTKFGLLYGAANRDPDQFLRPDVFDAGRTPNRHLAFGRGAHLCLGNNLARLDMEIIFTRLLARVRAIECTVSAPRFRTGLAARGLQALPLLLTPG